MIKVRYSSIDYFSKVRSFKTLAGARAFAVKYVGENPDMGSSYAVSFDGVGKITVDGCSLQELFYGKAKADLPYEVWVEHVYEDRYPAVSSSYRDSSWATLEEANAEANKVAEFTDGTFLVGATEEAKAAIAAQNEAYRASLWLDREIGKPAYNVNPDLDDDCPF